jgi:capsular polysaccharide biosynthesis protein
MAQKVIAKLRLKESEAELLRQIHVTFAGANLYRVSVSASSEKQAILVADAVAAEGVVFYRELPARTTNISGDQALIKARDVIGQAYVAAVTARLKFQAQYGDALAKNIEATAQSFQLQLQEDAAAGAYREVLAQTAHLGLDQVSQVRVLNAYVLDQAVARRDTGTARVPEILFAAALALMIGIGLIFFLEHLDTKSVRESEAVEEMIGAPVIGIVPRATAQALRPPKEGAA